MKIFLGPAGTPAHSTLEGISKLKELGLQCTEVQFSHGINMGIPLAKKVGAEAKKYGIKLSVHSPFFINLASDEKEKIIASKRRIINSCERAHYLGADLVVFHPAYFGKKDHEEVYQTTKKAIQEMQKIIKARKWKVRLAPETTGKHSALGSLDETIRLVKETGCFLCVDIAHLFARNNGKINYKKILDKLKFLKSEHLHFHFSGIKYSSKGELKHLNLNSHPDFKAFAKELLKRKIKCTIISETPITWRDSLKMRKIFEDFGHHFN